ncbi:MAG: MFS transporter [Myxococcales bacterium]|nr:MFS transporter [Myxococcales bacterium]
MEASLSSHPALERNLKLYPWLHVGRNGLFWLPIFVLYFSAHLSPAEVLRLEALYFFGVVLMEVPSGYLSDRIGRRPILIVATLAWALGSAVLALGGAWWVFAVGQLLLALGMSFQSGTDTSLLFDTLAELGREHEVAQREAQAQSWAFATLGASALVGGLIGSVDLSLGHALSAIAGCVGILAAAGMQEPPSSGRAPAPEAQVGDVMRHTSDPVLRWTLAHAIGFTVVAHIPYELFQPWLALLVGPSTPPAAGATVFTMMMLASVFGPRGPRLADALGPSTALLISWAVLVGVVASMAVAVHPAILAMIVLRSVPTALARPVLTGVTHPRLPSSLRATWLSLESLAGRLSFAVVLFASSHLLGASHGWTFGAMQALLLPVAAGAALLALGAWWLAPSAVRAPGSPPETPPDPAAPG